MNKDWEEYWALRDRLVKRDTYELELYIQRKKKEVEDKIFREYFKNLNKILDAKTVATQTDTHEQK